MDDRIRQISGRFKHKRAVDVDTNLSLNLETTTRLVKPNANPINSIIGQDDQFVLERDDSNLYRFSGRLNLITTNELTEGGDVFSYSTTPPTHVGFQEPAKDYMWDPFFDGFTVINPSDNILPNNWLLQLCYPSTMLDNYPLWEKEVVGGGGSLELPVSIGMEIKSLGSNNPSGNRSLLTVKTTQKHKLSEGDYVHINNPHTPTQYQGIHKVFELGINGDDLENSFTLETSYAGASTEQMFLKRVSNSSENDILFSNSIVISQIQMTDKSGFTVDNQYVLIRTGIEHNLTVGDYIEIRELSGGGVRLFNGTHRVENVIDNFLFTIKFSTISGIAPSGTIIPTANHVLRRMDGTPSDYYIRKFEVLTTNNYETYDASYSSSIYPETAVNNLGVSNKTWLFHFISDINLGELVSHRGGVVKELHLCVLKRAGSKPYDWTNVTSHWDFNAHSANTQNGIETVSKRIFGGVGSIVHNSGRTMDDPGSLYYGDIVEYNRKDIIEKVLTEVIFRFGINSGYVNDIQQLVISPAVTLPFPTGVIQIPEIKQNINLLIPADPDGDGYYYKPFKKLEIRKFSNIIERAEPDDNVEGIPADFEEYPDGSLAWRDLLPHGLIQLGNNGVDWPFMNGRHYVYLNHCIYLRRQNPKEILPVNNLSIAQPKGAC
jgi:hypothetical protein